MKKTSKLLVLAAALILMGTAKVYAADEEEIATTPVDTVAPVFSSDIQQRYMIQKSEEGTEFNPSDVIKGIKAKDDVDGNNVAIQVEYNGVDLSQEGEYQVLYSATDKAGNISYLSIIVNVDGIAPVFDETIEKTYYMTKSGKIFDSKHNVVESIPQKLIAKDSIGAYKGIGVYITNDLEGNIIFVEMIKDTPAEKSLKINDILVGVDGEDVRGQTPAYVASKIKGQEGTKVQLDIIRNQTELSIPVERQIIKLYEDEEITAEPNIDINSINKEATGTTEITYTATDRVGNTAEVVITVIIIDDEETDKIKEKEEGKESEELYNVTTSGTPPEDLKAEETTTSKETDKEIEIKEEKEDNKEAEIKEEKDNIEKTEKVEEEKNTEIIETDE